MRRALALGWVALVGFACGDPDPPFGAPANLDSSPADLEARGLEKVQRLDPSGDVRALALLDEHVFAAVGTGLDVLTPGAASSSERIPLPGQTRDVEAGDGVLWVAGGVAGIVRVQAPADPASRRVDRWATGGDVVDVEVAEGWVWAADRDGRVLALPAAADPDAAPLVSAIDGWPLSVAPRGDTCLVAAGNGGLHAVRRAEGRLEPTESPLAAAEARAVAQQGGGMALSTGAGFFVDDGGGAQTVDRRNRSRRVLLTDDGVLASGGHDGLLSWGGGDDPVVELPLVEPVTGFDLEVHDLELLGPDRAAVAAGNLGVAWLRRDGGTWVCDGMARHIGTVETLVADGDRLAVGYSTYADESTVIVFGPVPDGRLAETHRVTVPSPIRGVLLVDDELLITGVGLYSADLLSGPAPVARALDLVDEPVHDAVRLASGDVAALIQSRALLWLRREAPGAWLLLDESEIGREQIAMRPIALDDEVWVTTAFHGRLKHFAAPGQRQDRLVDLSGSAGITGMGRVLAGGAFADGDSLWLAIPRVGVERYTPSADTHQVLRFGHGALDVAPFAGGLLAAADGDRGVVLLDPTRPEDPVVGFHPAPGWTRHMVSWGDRLVVASEGTVLVLESGPGGEDSDPAAEGEQDETGEAQQGGAAAAG